MIKIRTLLDSYQREMYYIDACNYIIPNEVRNDDFVTDNDNFFSLNKTGEVCKYIIKYVLFDGKN